MLRTKAKEAGLLRVLKYLAWPMHNNAAEVEARARVRKRDASLRPRSPVGLKVRDTFMPLVETTRKRGVNLLAYVQDRLRGAAAIRPLGDVIRAKGTARNLTPAA